MFEPSALEKLRTRHQETLDQLVCMEDALNARFFGMESTVACMTLASLTGEAMVMLGPPGTAKSRLIRSYCNLLGLIGDDAFAPSARGMREERKEEAYFEYLLTQFTEPSELFGHYDLARLFGDEKVFQRDDSGMMQRARVVFLDEVFNASSAILNALLTFMNERKFHDRGRVQRVPMRLLFAASNHTPREEGLGAFYDRFLLRSRLDNVSANPESLSDMVAAAWTETHGHGEKGAERQVFPGLLEQLDEFRADLDRMTREGALSIQRDDPIFSRLADIVEELRRKDLSQMSNRRVVKFAAVVLAHSLLRATRESTPARIEPRDLSVILEYGLDADDASTVRKLLQDLR